MTNSSTAASGRTPPRWSNNGPSRTARCGPLDTLIRENLAAVRPAAILHHLPFAFSLVAGMALWEIAGRYSSPAFLVPLSTTLVRLWQLLLAGTLIAQTLDSGALFCTGLLLSVLVGMPAGLILARLPLLRVALDPYITVLYATPMVALIPFILSLMGFGFVPKVLVVFLFCVFPILYTTTEGARSIKPELLEVARAFRSGEGALWRDVLLPYTLPFTMTGIRLAIGRCLVGMVAAEFFLSSNGLGQLIMSASQNFDTGGVFAAILIICLIGLGLMRLGLILENSFARWRT
jgi:ABC-type nitrate/sulfonate/bicarbonate transport system permease component